MTVVAPEGPPSARLALVHGNGMCADFYRPLAHRLAAGGARVALVDLPGFAGVASPEPPGWDTLLDGLEPVLREQLGPSGILVGHSLGGLVSVLVAERLTLRALVLMEPAIVPWRWLATLAARVYVGRVFTEQPTGFTNRGPWFWRLHDPASFPTAVKDLVVRTHSQTDRSQVAAMHAELVAHYPLPLDRIAVPTLVVRGAASGPVMALGQRDLVRRLPQGRAVTIERAGHWLANEQDAALAEAILGFAAPL